MKSLVMLIVSAAFAAILSNEVSAGMLSDTFESGAFDAGWNSTLDSTIVNDVGNGALGSNFYAQFGSGAANNGGPLGDELIEGGTVPGAYVDFYLRIPTNTTTTRDFVFQFSTSANGDTFDGLATLNLRHQNGAWEAFNGSAFQNTGLPGLTPNAWHHVRVTANNFGTAGANYDIQVSDAGGTAFTSSAIGLTHFHNFGGTNAQTQQLRTFNFTSRFGNARGFRIDNVTTGGFVPEPGSIVLVLSAVSALAFVRRQGEHLAR